MPYLIKSQGHDFGPTFAKKYQAIATVHAFVAEDLKSCRFKFGRAFVVHSDNVWTVQAMRDSRGPMWSRYSIHIIV